METKLNGMQAKKEKRFKPQKQKAIIQPDLHFDIPKEEEEEPIEDVAPRNRPANTFFDDLEQVETLLFHIISMQFPSKLRSKHSQSCEVAISREATSALYSM